MPASFSTSRSLEAVRPSVIRHMFTEAAKYDDVISLGIGEPDFHTPAPIIRAAMEDALAGHTHYTASQGDMELRSELSAYMERAYGRQAAPENIMVTVGGMGALAALFRTLLNPGDQVMTPEPHFSDYAAHVAFAYGELVPVTTKFENGFLPRVDDLEAALTERTKVLLLNSPCNPTGAVMPLDLLHELARFAIEHDLIVVSDEVYARLIYEGAHHSIVTLPGMAERTVVVDSFSKAFAMTGWRLGWVHGPEELIKAMLKVVTFQTASAPAVSQRAALAALRLGEEYVAAMRDEFAARCRLAYERLAAMPGVKVLPPKGSFYLFPQVEGVQEDPLGFAMELLRKEQVVVVPGDSFGPSGKACIRVAATVPQDKLTIALNRLERFLASR